MSLKIIKKYYSKLKEDNLKQLMAEDLIGLGISAIMILLGDKIANKYVMEDYESVFFGFIILAGIVIFFLGPLFLFKTYRTQRISNNLHDLYQKNERRKDEQQITEAQLRVIDQEMTLVMLKQTEILEKNQRLWVKQEITDSQTLLKGKLDFERDRIDQESREKTENEFNIILKSFNSLRQEFRDVNEKLEFKKAEIVNDSKNVKIVTSATSNNIKTSTSKDAKSLKDLKNKELDSVLNDIEEDIDEDLVNRIVD